MASTAEVKHNAVEDSNSYGPVAFPPDLIHHFLKVGGPCALMVTSLVPLAHGMLHRSMPSSITAGPTLDALYMTLITTQELCRARLCLGVPPPVTSACIHAEIVAPHSTMS